MTYNQTYFLHGEKIKSIIIPYGVTQISGNFFTSYSKLEEISLPSSLKVIYSSAFKGCERLKNIDIPKSVEKICSYAFSDSGIESIIIPNSITKIYEGTFKNCTNLKEIIFPENLTEIGKYAFENTKLSRINIPKTTTKIGENPFFGVKSINFINVDEENTIYDSRNNCNAIIETATNTLITGIAQTQIPSTVEVIGQKAFSGTISELYIPEGIKEIEDYAFGGVDFEELNKITLPKSLTQISANAFKVLNDGGAYEIPENLVLWVYKNSYAETYAKENSIKLRYIDPIDISVNISKTNYVAFEKVNITDMYVLLTYDDDTQEYIGDGITVKYENDNNSFRYGDKYFIVSIYGKNGEYIEKKVEVTISKATPTFNLPNNLVAIEGQKLSEIALPKNFCWMDENQVINKRGKLTFKAKYIPDDTLNYETIEDVDLTVQVNARIKDITNAKVELEYVSTTYNGKTKKPNVKITLNNITLVENKDYKVAYKNNKYTGKATVTVTGIGNYTGNITKKFNIVPAKTSISSVKNVSKKSAKVTWKKDTQATGYEIYMSTAKADKTYMKTTSKLALRKSTSTSSKTLLKIPKGAKVKILKKNVKKSKGYTWYKVSYKGKTGYVASKYLETIYNEGKYSKIKTITKNKTTTYTKTKLSKGKKYTFKIRSYKIIDGKKVYGSYSKVKWVTIKK